MKLIVGLGNPGKQYDNTRHNAGFIVLEHLAQRHGLSGSKMKFHAGMLEGLIAGEKCVLLEPMTYMNNSGTTVGEAVNFYKLNVASDVLIVVDDLALPCGKMRLRPHGSAGGHNGLGDIQRRLGTTDYARLRIGIDAPGRDNQVDYVLGRFNQEQSDQLSALLPQACDAIETWIKLGTDEAMNRFNADTTEA